MPLWLPMHYAVLLLLLMAEIPTSYASYDYRKIYCEKGIHTMVLFPMEGPGPHCVGYKTNKLSQLEKDAILRRHNELRNSVALGLHPPFPKAADMMEMVWDEELEIIAQRIADQCMGDDNYDCNDVQRFRVGQIIAEYFLNPEYFEGTIKSIKKYFWKGPGRVLPGPEVVIQYFFDQIRYSTYATPPRPLRSDNEGNSFTQFVRGSTTHLGCARSSYIFNKQIRKLLVCNYGPKGNRSGEALYKAGTPCSECSCSTRYPALCDFLNQV